VSHWRGLRSTRNRPVGSKQRSDVPPLRGSKLALGDMQPTADAVGYCLPGLRPDEGAEIAVTVVGWS
jgi:hypothetical protein